VDDDFELLKAWRTGDREAGNALFDRHFDRLYRFFRNKVSDGAEDLVQQTFMACVQARDHFRGDASFQTYLYTAARSKLFTHLRRRRRRDDPIDWGVTSCADLGVSPSGAVAKQEQQQLLLAALRKLPLEMQIALELFYFEQIRGPQLAALLEVPEGTVRSRLRRGRELLKDRLERLADDNALVESTMSDLEGWAAKIRDGALAQKAPKKST